MGPFQAPFFPPQEKLPSMTGVIRSLRPGGFGFIASDAHTTPWELKFHRAGVADEGFDGLRVGQRVWFDREPLPGDPHRHRAVGVTPFDPAGS